MLFGAARTERILGLHRRPCHGCRPASARIVTRRRWAYNILGVPLLAFDARWRRCTGCRRRVAMPRLSLPVTVLATLILAFLLGRDVVAYGDLFVWTLLIGFWGVWLAGHVIDVFLDRTLVPAPPALFRPHEPAPTGSGARRRSLKSRLAHHPVGRWTRYVRFAKVPLRAARRVRARRAARKTSS